MKPPRRWTNVVWLIVISLPPVLPWLGCNKDRNEFSDVSLRALLASGSTNTLKEYLDSGGSANRSISLRKHIPVNEPLLHVAVASGQITVAQMLLQHGADIEGKDWEGNTPLMSALTANLAEDVRMSVAQWLIDHGANVRAKNGKGFYPLHLAVLLDGASRIANLLISNGCPVNSTNLVGQTPLHLCKDARTAAVLIANGANLNSKDVSGYTPLDQAIFHKKHEVIELLKGHTAR